MSQVKDLVGQVFGRLTVTTYAGQDRHKHSTWQCLCSCGGTITVSRVSLRSGRTSSCGCLRVENGRKAVAELAKTNHKGDRVGYEGAHYRVRTAKGSASEHDCVDCGEQARDWSLRHGSETKVGIDHGMERAFSTQVDDYEPRCRPCHKVYDLAVAQ